MALYLGDCREVLPALGVQADLIVADPPYGETSLPWDRWPDGWPTLAAQHTRSMWCFGSMRMFLQHASEFAGWKMSQDVIWEKANGTNFVADRFKRVHETVVHWYRDTWRSIHHNTPRLSYTSATGHVRYGRADRVAHTGSIGAIAYQDDGTRLIRSVIRANSVKVAIHPTEKPIDLLLPLISYGCPTAGLVVDLFAGSGATLAAAYQAGAYSLGIEANEEYLERAATRLAKLEK